MINLLIILSVYFVSFTDKPEKSAPALSPRAIEQRAKWNIPTDQLDYPVSKLYIDSLRKVGVTKVFHTSRWFNGATCEMDEETSYKVLKLGFVTDVEMTRDDNSQNYISRRKIPAWQKEDKWTDEQLALYNLLPLHEAGFEGQNILLTVCDGGFYNANKLSCFRQKELELGHFDFTDDADDFYGSSGAHGTECLSTISGIADGFYGAATKAKYYLMKSEEDLTESPKEMDNLVAAIEKADSLGVNVFSVSLGYSEFDNDAWTLDKNKDLDGKTTRSSRAATIAARKGMLVCVAAGNEGNKAWRTISSPADADSILTVGAVATDSLIGSFSSYGPSSDGRIKPEVCAVGVQTTLIYPDGTIVTGSGTSFATPLIAGLATALWSALPNENVMQIRERIIRSADRYNNPDPKRYGYGIPDAWKAYTMATEGIENLNSSSLQGGDRGRLILRGNQILILRNGKVYTVSGQRVQ